MKFEYLAFIAAALFLSNAMGDLLGKITWLTVGDLCVAFAIVCSYIDLFIKQLEKYKNILVRFAGGFACLGVISYVINFI